MLLSVLDLSFVTAGSTGADALRRTVDLARHVDTLGYCRFWMAEHHNLPSVASPAPEIMICRVASETRNLRVGSGGVMLPNHAPLTVVERFRMLEALFPGRIDLGLGRAPGTDPVTSYALRRLQGQSEGDEFLERLTELMAFAEGRFPEGHPFRNVVAMPADVPLPPIFLLGSSDYSAHLSARLGMGFGFAHHFASHDALDAMLAYRRGFRATEWGEKPHAILAVAVICAETDQAAEELAASADYSALRRARGIFAPIPTLDQALAAAADFTPADRAFIRRNRARLFVGSPETIRREVGALAAATMADEVMVTGAIPDHEARKRSFTLVAQALRGPVSDAALTPPRPAA